MVMRKLLSLSVLFLAASFARAQLRVGDIQPCQGPYGPAREPVYDLYDDVFIRGTLSGTRANERHYASVDVVGDVIGPNNEVVKHTSATAEQPQIIADQFPFNFHFAIDPTWRAGNYLVKVNLKDNESGKETSFTQKFTVQPQRFAMLPPQFYSDQEGKNPAPNGGHVGQVVYFRGWVVGLENSKGVDFEIGAEVRDSSAQKVLWKSRKKEIKESDPEKTKEAVGNLGGPIPLTTPGNYILRTFAIDHLARKSVCCDFPLHIEAPGKGMRYEGESKELPYEALLPPAVSAIPPPLPPEVIQVSSPPK
jgi:hypothetical protein